MWCIPPKANAEFAWRMEAVLSVYKRPYNPDNPVVCMDEASTQLTGQVRQGKGLAPGRVATEDSEYERKGTCNLFLYCEPLRGWRRVIVTGQRRKVEWACSVKAMLEDFPNAKIVTLVCDNLNTHTGGALYEAFGARVAKALCERLDIQHTPKHGSWLNMAETELSILSGDCLDRHMISAEFVASEVKAWEIDRNQRKSKIRWSFTVEQARVKLVEVYPAIDLIAEESPDAGVETAPPE